MTRKATKASQIARALTNLGWRETPSDSRRYRRFILPDLQTGETRTRWLGKAGALRVGRTISRSVSITASVPIILRRWLTDFDREELGLASVS